MPDRYFESSRCVCLVRTKNEIKPCTFKRYGDMHSEDFLNKPLCLDAFQTLLSYGKRNMADGSFRCLCRYSAKVNVVPSCDARSWEGKMCNEKLLSV